KSTPVLNASSFWQSQWAVPISLPHFFAPFLCHHSLPPFSSPHISLPTSLCHCDDLPKSRVTFRVECFSNRCERIESLSAMRRCAGRGVARRLVPGVFAEARLERSDTASGGRTSAEADPSAPPQ